MPVLQWGCYVFCHFSFLLASSLYISRRTPAWPDDRGDHLQYARSHSQLPRSAFLAAQAILGCMIAQTSLVRFSPRWPSTGRSCLRFTGDVAFQRHRGLVIGAL